MMASHTRFSSTRAAVLALLSATTAAVANAHILLPFSRDEAKTAHQLSARADSQAVPVFSNSFAYVVNASIGTPPQHVSLVISPSIGDTFMPDASSTMCSPETRYRYCSDYEPYEYANGTIYTPRPYDPTKWGDAPGTPCKNGKVTTPGRCKWGSYNQSLSSTYLPANARYSNFDPNYLHPRVASGTNITDTLMVGDIEMEDYPMGIVSSSSATWWIGVLGLGYNSTTSSTSYSSSSYAENWSGSYVNFMDRLVRSGKIKSQAYSIYLDNPEGTSGGLLFGAVDQSRYTGDLVRLSARNTYVYDRTFGTTLHSINGTNSTDSAMASFKSNDFPLDVTIGVGELYSYLPNLLADRIAEMAGASFDEDLSQFTIPCDAAKTSKAKFRFEIGGSGGPILQVEVPDLVIPAGVYIPGMRSYRNTYDYLASNNTCLFGVQKYSSSSSSSSSYSSSNSGYYNIGSSLLRRSYLVFDLANQEVAVAAVKFPSGSERLDPKILTFDSQGITAPGSKAFQDICDTYTSRSYGCNSNSNNGSRSSRYTPPEDESHWQKVAIGISVPFGALFIVGVVAGIVICSRLHKEKKAKDKGVGREDTDVESQAGADADGVTRPAMAATRGGGGFRASQGPLPAIEERPETAASVKQQESAPQLPALSLTPPPPEPTEASDRNSVAVSALSEDATTAPAPAAATIAISAVEDKGKGKELDHSA